MSAEDVELVRRGVAAFNARGPDGILEMMDPDIELQYGGVLIDKAAIYSGRDGIRDLLITSWEDFERVQVEIVDCVDRDGRVVGGLRVQATGIASGAPIDLQPGYVMTVRGAKVVHWRICQSYAEALEAADAMNAADRP
jgi:ketosteroid isomerase-like protein